jgi:tRNA/rRNA methyltransferase
MSFWTYMLRCADQSYYTGHTDDIDYRVGQHQSGTVRGYTFTRRPVELVWAEQYETRAEALETEFRVKGWSRAKKEALIARDWDRLKKMAMPPLERADRNSAALGIIPGKTRRYSVESAPSAYPERSRGTSSSEAEKQNKTNPLIILVRPQLGENIGKAARAMLNFGLTELRLVAPRDGWPNPSAGPAAAGADIVLEKAQVYETLAEATADCSYIYATTVRKRGIIKPVTSPEEAATEIRTNEGRSAILFGPERAGLESDDVAVASTIITVPINPEFGSLNLAQAVILVAYEWSKGAALTSPPKVDIDPPAPQAELDGMIAQLDAMLEAAGHFYPPDRAHIDRRTIRSILTKPRWSAQEVRTFRGMLRSLSDRVPRKP